ncbi:hypothetical protein [Achromobacter denitrificans]|uniref:hypothetical protein n=1 Tax=Achromobacter denitrificans TaxID=32002 RepID=UPI0023E7F448|nr:hypothetical protein [Achromobacter denitrificans]MDF3850684.1 hypothetical protein [Achromobacter denitrificans]MDX3877035.1 hypothetical protein [Achromobacter sp.]
MKNLLIDAAGLAGFGCVAAGVYVQFGTGPALLAAGALMLGFALRAAARGKR